ncbi:MAG: asparagine synthetase B family protein [Candidatus Helarchaeota archaeon]
MAKTIEMGLIAGISSRDRSNIVNYLYKFAMKLRHRGNSDFCIFLKGGDGWEMILSQDIKELLSHKSHCGIVGRHLLLDRDRDTIPYVDCEETRFLLLDGKLFDINTRKQELSRPHRGNLETPSLILHLFEELKERIFDYSRIFQKILDSLKGMYAAALIMKRYVFLFRDLIGIKPLYLYTGPKYVAFASEKKALWAAGLTSQIEPLRPGRVVRFAETGFTSHFQLEYNITQGVERPINYYQQALLNKLRTIIKMLLPSNPFTLLLSGGLDSTIIAALLTETGQGFKSIVLGTENSGDIQFAQQTADFLGQSLGIFHFDVTSLEGLLPSLIYHVESRDEKKINIAFPLYTAAQHLYKQHVQIIFTGQGADEIFGGYARHERQFKDEPSKLPEQLWNDVKALYQVNLQRNDAVAMAHTVQLRLPYLTKDLIEFSMQIPPHLKIQPPVRKYILRQIGKKLGLPAHLTHRPKRAIQFSSGSYETLKKLSQILGFTKDFALAHGFFSPTQLLIDSLAVFLGFPNIDPKVIRFVEETRITWPDSFQNFENIVNRVE